MDGQQEVLTLIRIFAQPISNTSLLQFVADGRQKSFGNARNLTKAKAQTHGGGHP